MAAAVQASLGYANESVRQYHRDMEMKSQGAAVKTEDQAADDRVTFTKRNWTGRFLRAEVNYGDFQRIMGNIQTWEQWLPAWAEKARDYEALAEAAEKRGARHSAAEAWRRAAAADVLT